jgi:hypothetical protein
MEIVNAAVEGAVENLVTAVTDNVTDNTVAAVNESAIECAGGAVEALATAGEFDWVQVAKIAGVVLAVAGVATIGYVAYTKLTKTTDKINKVIDTATPVVNMAAAAAQQCEAAAPAGAKVKYTATSQE